MGDHGDQILLQVYTPASIRAAEYRKLFAPLMISTPRTELFLNPMPDVNLMHHSRARHESIHGVCNDRSMILDRLFNDLRRLLSGRQPRRT